MDEDGFVNLSALDDTEYVDRKCVERFETLSNNFKEFKKKLTSRIGGRANVFVINDHLLMHAIESYFKDIKRLKDFHPIARADRFKIAGYTIKWLSKIRPIQVRPFDLTDEELALHATMINARFAVMVGLSVAGVDHQVIIANSEKPLTGTIDDQSHSIVETMIYSAVYRDLDGTAWAQLLVALHTAYPKPWSAV